VLTVEARRAVGPAQKSAAERVTARAHQAELAAREVEASWAATYQRSHAARLLRALDCYTQAYVFVRADGPRWAVQHINEAAIKMTGARRGRRAGPAPARGCCSRVGLAC